MQKRRRILQLQPDYHENSHNYSDLAEQISLAFPKTYYKVTNAFLRGKPEAWHPLSNVEETVYFDVPKHALGGARLGVMRKIYRYCCNENFDVVICNRYKQVSLMLHLNRWLKVPVCVGISHGFGEYDNFVRRVRAKTLINDAWRFVGVSDAVRDYLLEKRCGFTESNTFAINNAFDIDQADRDRLSRQSARDALELPQDALLIGAAGRLVPVKGHIFLVRAFEKIAAQHPNAILAIIGEGKERAALEDEIARSGLGERIRLLGFRAGAKRYMKAFDVWTMPSLSEGFGLALVEGMAAALPIIASDLPAMTSMIIGAGGLAVTPKDSDALADGIDRYLSLTTQDREALGQNARAYLMDHHQISDYRKAYRELVEDALNKRKIRG